MVAPAVPQYGGETRVRHSVSQPARSPERAAFVPGLRMAKIDVDGNGVALEFPVDKGASVTAQRHARQVWIERHHA
jgi:hypothetical protein